MRRGTKRILRAVVVTALLLGSAVPAHAASLGLNCNTYTNSTGAYSIKLCFTTYQVPSSAVGEYRAQINFCNWYPNDPCEANQLEIQSLRLRWQSCSSSTWVTLESVGGYQFDPRNQSNTHTPDVAMGSAGWYQAFADFRIRWLNNVWTADESAQSFQVYDGRGQGDCPNRYSSERVRTGRAPRSPARRVTLTSRVLRPLTRFRRVDQVRTREIGELVGFCRPSGRAGGAVGPGPEGRPQQPITSRVSICLCSRTTSSLSCRHVPTGPPLWQGDRLASLRHTR